MRSKPKKLGTGDAFCDYMERRAWLHYREGYPAVVPLKARNPSFAGQIVKAATEHVESYGRADPFLGRRVNNQLATGIAGPGDYSPKSEPAA